MFCLHYILLLSGLSKKGIEEVYMDITWKVTAEDIEAEEICNKFGLNEDEK